MKKRFWILICFLLVVVLAVVFWLAKCNSPKSENDPKPTPVVLEKDGNGYFLVTDAMLKQFQIKNVGTETLAYLQGAASGDMTLFQPESLSVTNNDKNLIYTVTVKDRTILCGTFWNEEDFCVSKDGTRIAFSGYDTAEKRSGLIIYDLNAKTSELVSDDVYEGKTADYYGSISLGDGFGIKWIVNPRISEDNQLIAYESNRRTYEEYAKSVKAQKGNENESDSENNQIPYPSSDIWLKDLKNGKEYLLTENASVLFWVNRSLAYAGSDGSYILNIDTQETKKLPENFTLPVPNTYYLKKWAEEELALYDVKTEKQYSFSLKEADLQSVGADIYTAEDGRDYAIVYYRTTEKKEDGFYRYFIGIIDISSGSRTVYALPESFNQQGNSPSVKGIVNSDKIILFDKNGSSNKDYFLIHLGTFIK